MPQLQITPALAIDENEIEEHFTLSSGPGGQNVNKVASAVQLRFDARASQALSDDLRARLKRLAGRRMNKDGILIIDARRFRSQERNREDARLRLVELLAKAASAPKLRKKTRPSRATKEKRLGDKAQRAHVKNMRARPIDN